MKVPVCKNILSKLFDATLSVMIKTASKVNDTASMVNKDWGVSKDCCVAIMKNKSELQS